MRTPLVVIVGPTASGKSTLALELALRLGESGRAAEIVNGDSMLVYRGMDIGTAKPTPAERARVPHHLIDIMDVTRTANLAEFQGLARGAIADIRARGAIPILVGGSALYTHAILDEFDFQPSDPAVRARWEAELARLGPAELYDRLRAASPESAARIEPGNGRRIVRALEVLELSGNHIATLPEWRYALDDVIQFGLEGDRDLLDARIDARVDAMWAQGLVDEVRGLLRVGLRDGTTAIRAIGYRQVVSFLDGECSEEEAMAQVKRATRRFVRKQLGWYRRDPRIQWLRVDDPTNAHSIIAGLRWGNRD